jgi:endonuclease YncB( thermonuclease family)
MVSASGCGASTRRRARSSAGGDDSLPYRCGAKAANDLATFIAQQSVRCIPISLDQYGRTVATCSVGGADLAEWLVRSGLALDWPQYSKRKYDLAQRDYRACIRANGRPTDCSDDANAHP